MIKYSFSKYRHGNRRLVWRPVVGFLYMAAIVVLIASAFAVVIAITSEVVTAEERDRQGEYIAALENALDRCLSGGDMPIQIGDELWMCGAANTGVKVK